MTQLAPKLGVESVTPFNVVAFQAFVGWSQFVQFEPGP